MSITDELRERIDAVCRVSGWDCKRLTAIADRIDSEHEKAIASVMNDALYHANDKDMADLGWVRLPKDADGEYIHIGDVMEWPDGKTFDVIGIGDGVLFYIENADGPADWTGASTKHHHKQPTVEDLLREMHAKLDEVTALYVGEAIDSDERDSDEARIFAEYAAKLRLAGDGE